MRLWRSFCVAIFCLLAHCISNAQNLPQGATSTVLYIAGGPVTCTFPGGRAVPWTADHVLRDVGNTGLYGIRFNPDVLAPMTDHLKLFWLGHECGHAHLQTSIEADADCFAATIGVRQGWFNLSDFEGLKHELAHSPGDQTHPPGDVRLAHVYDCMAAASTEGGSGTRPDIQDADAGSGSTLGNSKTPRNKTESPSSQNSARAPSPGGARMRESRRLGVFVSGTPWA